MKKDEKNIKAEEEDIKVTEENVDNDVKNNEEEANADSSDNAATEESETSEKESEKEEKSPIDAANEQIEQLKDKYLRTVAEFDNYKKRTLKEKDELRLNGGEKTISAILPVLDDFERAIDNADKTEDINAIKEGMELIFKKFTKTLESLGVKKIETDGQDFNVDYHEAIAMVPGMGDDKKGKVIDCVQTGYTLNEKVIRHAKVAVGQ